MKFIIYTDGASRGNPGPASYGYAIYSEEGIELFKEGSYLGINTNNFAEYSAVINALSRVREKQADLLAAPNDAILSDRNKAISEIIPNKDEKKIKTDNLVNIEIHIYADSQLVVEQLSGRYKIKSPNLFPLIQEIRKLEQFFTKVTYTHIPREKNKVADQMANEALDNRDLALRSQ